MKPRLLDLCCGAGGATRGYQRAGYHVTGVDIRLQPRYCGDAFIQADALQYLSDHGAEYDAIHASPPCQGYSLLRYVPNRCMDNYPMLVDDIRRLMISIGRPWVIENVPGAPLLNPLILCGTMFGLLTHRHRAFESNPTIWFPPSQCNRARA
jgi:DNA (cytosine-5)-methyltransferase 1